MGFRAREQDQARLRRLRRETTQQFQDKDLGPAVLAPRQDRREVDCHDVRVTHHLLNSYRSGPAKGAEFNAIGKAGQRSAQHGAVECGVGRTHLLGPEQLEIARPGVAYHLLRVILKFSPCTSLQPR